MLELDASVCHLEYYDPNYHPKKVCHTLTDMRRAFVQNPAEETLKKIGWLFMHNPYHTYRCATDGARTHHDLTVAKFIKQNNIVWSDRKTKKNTCIDDMYTKVIAEKRHNLMARAKNPVVPHGYIVSRRPKVLTQKMTASNRLPKKARGAYYIVRDKGGPDEDDPSVTVWIHHGGIYTKTKAQPTNQVSSLLSMFAGSKHAIRSRCR